MQREGWGTGRVCVRIARVMYASYIRSDLAFATGFSSFEGRPLKNLRKVCVRCTPHPPIRAYEDERYRSFYDYKGLDLIKWEDIGEHFPGHFGSRIIKRPVIKTGFIRLLQRQARRFINDKRRDRMNSYLLRLFHKDELCPDILTNIAAFIV